MPATEKSSLNNRTIKTLGVIAGGGNVPALLLQACDAAGQDVFLIGFEGQTDPAITQGRQFMMTRLGAAGQIVNTLHSHEIKDLVFIGSIRRPSLSELKPDMRAARFFARVGMRAIGDDNLLKAIRYELEQEGFNIHGVHEFAENLLALAGQIGRYGPKKSDWPDITHGFRVARELGRLDIGQSVVIQDGLILGLEAIEGTDELIRRCAGYRRHGHRGPLLIKACKPQQDHDLDLPTVGPETVRICAESGVSGIVIQAGKSLLIAPQDVAALADRHKIFVVGIDPEEVDHAA